MITVMDTSEIDKDVKFQELVAKIRSLENDNMALELKVDALSETTLNKENTELQAENKYLRDAYRQLELESSSLKTDREISGTSERALKEINVTLAEENSQLKKRVEELDGIISNDSKRVTVIDGKAYYHPPVNEMLEEMYKLNQENKLLKSEREMRSWQISVIRAVSAGEAVKHV